MPSLSLVAPSTLTKHRSSSVPNIKINQNVRSEADSTAEAFRNDREESQSQPDPVLASRSSTFRLDINAFPPEIRLQIYREYYFD